jgi:ADP-ribosyl-[dinitrogen reductase] hydrolase
MLGAIAGDIIGSTHEFCPVKTVEFPLFSEASKFTDDTVLTVATAFSLLTDGDYAENYRIFGRLYPLAGYGKGFKEWLSGKHGKPYGSWGNGSAMRVGPVGFAFDTEEEVLREAEKSAAVTHDHPEGIKGAQAMALGILLARQGAEPDRIKKEITDRFGYDLDRTVQAIRPEYDFDVSCQGSVPEAIICFLEGDDWEQAVRLAVSLGGDADTQACMAGALAQARFGHVPSEIEMATRRLLPGHLHEVVEDFENKFMSD